MLEKVAHTKQVFTEELQKAATLQDLEQTRFKYLARSGEIAALFEEIKSAVPAEKPALGKTLNELRQYAQAQFDEKKLLLEQSAKPKEVPFDLTLPGRSKRTNCRETMNGFRSFDNGFISGEVKVGQLSVRFNISLNSGPGASVWAV